MVTEALCASALLFALWCGPASAKVLLKGSFGSFSTVEGIAVESSSGDVYVYDRGQEAIFKFDAEGEPVNFGATGSNEISGVGSPTSYEESQLAVDEASGPAKGDLYLARGGESVQVFSAAGAKLGEFANEGLGLACGVAVDPSGAVYVGISSGQINKYAPSGNPVTNADLVSTIVGLGESCDLAVDSTGNVFASHREGKVTRYEASQFGSIAPIGSVVDTIGGTLAVDWSNDDLDVNQSEIVSQFGSHGEPFEEPLATFGAGALQGAIGIAVNDITHYIYVANGYDGDNVNIYADVTKPQVVTLSASHVDTAGATLNGTVTPDGYAINSCSFEYGASSAYGQSVPCLENVGSGEGPVAVHADVSGLSPGAAYHFRLVASNANGSAEGADQTFSTPAPPEVSGLAISHVSESEASVSAEIDPQRLATTYRVEYGTTESYGMRTKPLELVSQDANDHRVTVELAGLEPGATYHARLVAVNALGAASSPDSSFTTSQPTVVSCPNEALRTGLSARLPDCRVYEQVSMREKEGASTSESLHTEGQSVTKEEGLLFKAASNGDSMYYVTSDAIAGSPAGGQAGYEADRSSSGWLTTPLSPPNLLETTPKSSVQAAVRTAEYNYLSEDLSCKLVQTAEPLTADTPAADISQEVVNLYRRNADGTYTLLSNVVPSNPEVSYERYKVIGATPNCKKIVFASEYLFMPNAPLGTLWIYEWDEGTLRFAGALPGGELPFFGDDPSQIASESSWGKVSENGSRIFFEALSSSFQVKLFMREDNGTAGAKTVEVDASQTSVPTGSSFFQAASKTGARVFFLGDPGLTPGNPHTSGSCQHFTGQACDLYEYDTESSELTDISVDDNPLDADANVDGVFAISADGSYVYFAAKGQLTPSGGDPHENTEAQNESQAEANVYVAHGGSLAFVGRIDDNSSNGDELSQTLSNSEYNDLLNWPLHWEARATPDGRSLLFTSTSQLTGYDNRDAVLGTLDPEAYLYSVDTGKTVCVSCDPSGARPVYESIAGEARLDTTNRPIVPMSNNWFGQTSLNNQPRVLSEDGQRVFFETTDQLSPLTKSKEDNVYEWEMAGAGSCTSSSRDYSEASGGCVYLLDSGLPESEYAVPATFVDASANGDDVFLRTPSKLLPEDEDGLADIYDVRVDGGLARQQATVPCEGEACQGLAAGVPTFATPSTASLSGSGNQKGSQAHGRSTRLSRAQRLARSLEACAKKKGRHTQRLCRRKERKRYGAVAARTSARRNGGRG
jgi:Fibronectin type III domain